MIFGVKAAMLCQIICKCILLHTHLPEMPGCAERDAPGLRPDTSTPRLMLRLHSRRAPGQVICTVRNPPEFAGGDAIVEHGEVELTWHLQVIGQRQASAQYCVHGPYLTQYIPSGATCMCS